METDWGPFQLYDSAAETEGFQRIPDVVRERIMQSLLPNERLNARLISKSWSEEKVFGSLTKIIFKDFFAFEIRKRIKERVVLSGYRLFTVKSWAAVRFILSKCKFRYLKSVIIENCSFQDNEELPYIGSYFRRLHNLELIQLGNLTPDSIMHLVDQTRKLRSFAFHHGEIFAYQLPYIAQDITSVMQSNRNLTSLTIIDSVNDYQNFQIIKPLTHVNLQINNVNSSLRNSLEQTSSETLQCAVEKGNSVNGFNDYSGFYRITDIRIGNITRLPDLSHFPVMLTTLTLKFRDHVSVEECSILFRHQSNLEVFDSDMIFTSNTHLINLTYWCPMLKILMFRLSFRLYPNTISRLKTLKRLEKLDILYTPPRNSRIPCILDNEMADLINSLQYLRVFFCNDISVAVLSVEAFFQKAIQNPYEMYFIYTPILRDIDEDNPSIPFNVVLSKQWIQEQVFSLPLSRKTPFMNFDYWVWKNVLAPKIMFHVLLPFKVVAKKVEPGANVIDFADDIPIQFMLAPEENIIPENIANHINI